MKNSVAVDAKADAGDIKKLKVKELKQILADRGIDCNGCTEKDDFVKKVLETSP